MRLGSALVLAFALAACGSPAKICSGTSCDCPSDQSCSFDGCSASTDSCKYNCQSGSTCSGTCGSNCNVTCGGKSCTHTVGAGSSVTCSSGTCNITCNGTCSVAGSGTITLTCSGGTTASAAGCS